MIKAIIIKVMVYEDYKKMHGAILDQGGDLWKKPL